MGIKLLIEQALDNERFKLAESTLGIKLRTSKRHMKWLINNSFWDESNPRRRPFVIEFPPIDLGGAKIRGISAVFLARTQFYRTDIIDEYVRATIMQRPIIGSILHPHTASYSRQYPFCFGSSLTNFDLDYINLHHVNWVDLCSAIMASVCSYNPASAYHRFDTIRRFIRDTDGKLAVVLIDPETVRGFSVDRITYNCDKCGRATTIDSGGKRCARCTAHLCTLCSSTSCRVCNETICSDCDKSFCGFCSKLCAQESDLPACNFCGGIVDPDRGGLIHEDCGERRCHLCHDVCAICNQTVCRVCSPQTPRVMGTNSLILPVCQTCSDTAVKNTTLRCECGDTVFDMKRVNSGVDISSEHYRCYRCNAKDLRERQPTSQEGSRQTINRR